MFIQEIVLKSKQEKSQGFLLSCNSNQLTTWEHKCPLGLSNTGKGVHGRFRLLTVLKEISKALCQFQMNYVAGKIFPILLAKIKVLILS